MARGLRLALVAAGSLLALLAAVAALAWFLMPKDWIDREARRQASRVSGATIRWERLTPGVSGLSLGVRLTGLYARLPDHGPARLEASAADVFVSFKLLPLLSRRVEISAARVRGGGLAVTDRGPAGGGERGKMPPAAAGAAMVVLLPRVELEDLDVRVRDSLGGGVDLRGLWVKARMDGSVSAPRSIGLEATAESLYWKPSGRDAEVALPGPLEIRMEATAEGKTKLRVTQGEVRVGPLQSRLSGEVRLSGAGHGPEMDLLLAGGPQEIRSSDEALRPLASRSPATWTTRAQWEVRLAGRAGAATQTGRVTLSPLSVAAGSHAFAVDRVSGEWSVAADRTFTATVKGSGSDVSLALDARGSTAPGGASKGVLVLRAPAARLNGLVPDAPTWSSGSLECRADFTLAPPAPPSVRWSVLGTGLKGTVPGVARPVERLDFDLAGDEKVVHVKSVTAAVGSTHASLSGTVLPGKPFGTGTFRASLDRFVAEEWAPPAGAAGSATAAKPAAKAAPPPIPLRAFDAAVTIGELRSGTLLLRDVTVPVRFDGATLTAEPIRAGIGSGSLSGGMRVIRVLTEPSYSMHFDVKRAPAGELTSGLLPAKLELSGFASGVIDLEGPGFPGGPATEALRGALTGTIEEGKFQETPTILGLRKALGLGPTTGDLVFRTITQSVRIERGRLLLDRIRGDVGKDLFELTGSMGFDRSLDLNLLLRLDPSRIQGGSALAAIARYAKDRDGRFPLDLKITGTATAPKISFKPSKAVQIAGNRMAEDLVKSMTRRAAGDSAAADSAPDPTQAGREAIQRLLGK